MRVRVKETCTPRISDDNLHQQALHYAFLDRESLSDAYGGKGEAAEEAMTTARKIMALQENLSN